MGTVNGIGINDKKGYTNTLEYSHWSNLIKRCYSDVFQERHPSTIGSTLAENFKSFSYFYDWCQTQIGFDSKGFDLDKDLLIKGNKHYSESTCVFLPHEINKLLIKHKGERGVYPIGVHLEKKNGKLKSQINIDKRKVFLGYYDCPIKAFRAYKNSKESHIRNMANRHRSRMDVRAYEALMSYTVDITD